MVETKAFIATPALSARPQEAENGPLSASWEAGKDVGGNGLDLVALVLGVTDRIHQKIAAARRDEAIELLEALLWARR